MIRAIRDYRIVGIESTLPFGEFVMRHEAFRSGHFDTNFVPQYFSADELTPDLDKDEEEALALLTASLHEKTEGPSSSLPPTSRSRSNWKKRLNG